MEVCLRTPPFVCQPAPQSAVPIGLLMVPQMIHGPLLLQEFSNTWLGGWSVIAGTGCLRWGQSGDPLGVGQMSIGCAPVLLTKPGLCVLSSHRTAEWAVIKQRSPAPLSALSTVPFLGLWPNGKNRPQLQLNYFPRNSYRCSHSLIIEFNMIWCDL